MLEIRPRQDLTQDSGQDRDDIESFTVFFYENQDKVCIFGSILLKITHLDQDESETRLRGIEQAR